MPEPDYKALAKRLSNALLKVRPLGGSELFIRFGEEEFYADPDYCGKAIDKLREDLHNERIECGRLRRLLTPVA